MDNNNESVLKIILNEGTRPIVETIADKETSLFSELYNKTFSSIEQYLTAVWPKNNEEQETIVKTDNPNNIIAFLGERGSGKTSCMLSVAQMLQDKKDGADFFDYEKLGKTKFVSVSVIEPSFIDDKAKVLELVIAKLFKTFKEKVEQDTQNNNANLKHKLIESFQNVQKDLQFCQSKDTELDTIDSLLQLSSNVDLKQHLQKLIDTYLKFVTSDSKENKVLLLTIDDIDLNTEHAYAMVEQIRKYLILPNVLILVSLKLDQLEQVLKNEFIKQFKESLNYPKDNNPLISDIQQMAERYIQKLIPLEHRVFMPDMEAAMDKPYVVYKTKEEEAKEKAKEKYKDDCKQYKNDESKLLKHQILARIFEKTRFLFYNTKGKASYIIPRNLREFCNLVSLLHNLPDYKEDANGNCYNKTIFKKYFYDTWCENNLSVDKNVWFQQIICVQDAVDINATVLRVLQNLLKELNLYNDLITAEHYKYILSEKNYKWNISLGDVMAILNYCESHTASLDDLKFIFAIKTHYSIKLYEYYNELTATDPVMPLVNTLLVAADNNATNQIIRKDSLSGHSNYAKLVGGSFIHSGIFNIITSRQDKETRAQRNINFSYLKKLKQEIDDYKKKNLPTEVSLLTDEKRSDLNNCKNKIQFIEFFLLLLSRKSDAKYKNKVYAYREEREVYYSVNLQKVETNVWFDVASCFLNCLNIKAAYERVFSDFGEIITAFDAIDTGEQTKSLYSQLKAQCGSLRLHIEDEQHQAYSAMAIRNIEVLEDLISVLTTSRNDGGTEEQKAYENFFKIISSYQLPIYEVDEASQQHCLVTYSAFKVFSDFLSSISPQTSIYEDFTRIFMENKIHVKLTNFPRGVKKSTSIIEDVLELNDNYFKLDELKTKLNENFINDKYSKTDAQTIINKIVQELSSEN